MVLTRSGSTLSTGSGITGAEIWGFRFMLAALTIQAQLARRLSGSLLNEYHRGRVERGVAPRAPLSGSYLDPFRNHGNRRRHGMGAHRAVDLRLPPRFSQRSFHMNFQHIKTDA